MPVMDIQPIIPDELIPPDNGYAILLFISSNAVKYGLPFLQKKKLISGQCLIAAVGQKTAQSLALAGFPPQIVSKPPFNSEMLLQTHEMKHVEGKNILIIRGQGGRALLGDILCKRGALVDYLEVYQRIIPACDYSNIRQMGRKSRINAIITTSNEALQNLVKICQDEAWIFDTQLLVLSKRASNLAEKLGFHKPALIASEASDQGILQCLCRWAKELKTIN